MTHIISGTDLDADVPFLSVIKYVGNNNRVNTYCSAVAVAPEWVMSALHCVRERPNTMDVFWTARIGSRNRNSGGTVANITDFVLPPTGATALDTVLLRISPPVSGPFPDALAQVPTAVDAGHLNGTTIWAYGWGSDDQRDYPTIAKKISGILGGPTTRDVPSDSLEQLWVDFSPGVTGDRDSGGPALSFENTGDTTRTLLWGVMSRKAGTKAGEAASFAAVGSPGYRTWFTNITGMPLQEPVAPPIGQSPGSPGLPPWAVGLAVGLPVLFVGGALWYMRRRRGRESALADDGVTARTDVELVETEPSGHRAASAPPTSATEVVNATRVEPPSIEEILRGVSRDAVVARPIRGGVYVSGPDLDGEVVAGDALTSHEGYFTVAVRFDAGRGLVLLGTATQSVGAFAELVPSLPGWADAMRGNGGVAPDVILVVCDAAPYSADAQLDSGAAKSLQDAVYEVIGRQQGASWRGRGRVIAGVGRIDQPAGSLGTAGVIVAKRGWVVRDHDGHRHHPQQSLSEVVGCWPATCRPSR